MKKALLALHLLFGGFACATFGTALLAPAEVRAQNSKTINLKGKIGGKYAFTMHLKRTADGAVSGYYYYGDGKNGNLTVSGTRDRSGNITLTEYNPKGEPCGSWNVKIRRYGNTFRIGGTMINYKGKTFTLSGEQY